MKKVVVIGGGASGVVAAINASINNDVTLLEGNDKILKKLLLTGNGKCNYWNEFIDETKYQTDDIDKLNNILKYKEDTLDFLYNIGLYPKIKDGYYYPYSQSSNSVREIFIKSLEKSNVRIITNFKVKDINYNNGFIIKSDNDVIRCDILIIATGSKAYPKTGSDGSGYDLIKKFNHKINDVTTALVPLKTDDKFLKECVGIRTNSLVKLKINNEFIKQELGELQITDYGVSGICIFNLSGIASKNLDKNVSLEIDFLPDIKNIYEFINDRSKLLDSNIELVLESIFNYKLLFTFFKKSKIDKSLKWKDMSEEEKNTLCNVIKHYTINVIGTLDFDRSQTCTGGISLNEINDDMSSIYNENLFFTGEILDVNGDCGGYNLAFCFITGLIAGRSLNDTLKKH